MTSGGSSTSSWSRRRPEDPRVTQDQGLTNEEPSWAANGRLLVFVTDRGGRPQLVISNPAGDRQRVVTSDPADLAAPSWGPLPPP